MGMGLYAYTKARYRSDTTSDSPWVALYNIKKCMVNVKYPGDYVYDTRKDFYGGTCQGYNRMRQMLASMVGYKTLYEVWEQTDPSIPFIRIFNAGDNEGGWDNESCKELAEQFKEWEEISCWVLRADFQYFYKSLKDCFTYAADNEGIVCIH